MTTPADAPTLFKQPATISYLLSILTLGTFTALSGPALPFLAENTGSQLDTISLYFVLGSLGYLLGSFLGGRMADRVSGHKLLSLTLFVIAASGAMIPVLRDLRWLLAVQFALGLAQGANDVGCNTLMLWSHSRQAGPYLNGLHFSFGVGTTLAPLVLAGFLSRGAGLQWAYWTFALLTLPLAAWLWGMPAPPTVEKRSSPQSPSPAGLFPAALLALAFLFYVGGEMGFGNWVYTYSLSKGLGTAVTSAALTAGFWGTFTAGRLLGIWISSRLSPIRILAADLLGCLASLGLIALFPDSSFLLWVGTIGSGLFMASVFPTMLVLAGERLEITGALTSWFLVGGGLGGMLLPWVIGQAFVAIGPAALPRLILGTFVLNLVAIALFQIRTGKNQGGSPA